MSDSSESPQSRRMTDPAYRARIEEFTRYVYRLRDLCEAMDASDPCPDLMHPGAVIEWGHVMKAVEVMWAVHGGVVCECEAVCRKVMALPGPWRSRKPRPIPPEMWHESLKPKEVSE